MWLHGAQGQIDENIDGRISLNDCCCSKTLIGDAHLSIYAFPEFLFFTGEGKKSKSNLQEIDYVARTYIIDFHQKFHQLEGSISYS